MESRVHFPFDSEKESHLTGFKVALTIIDSIKVFMK